MTTLSPARPAQVVKALAMLAGNVDLWEADGRAHTLDLFLNARIPWHNGPVGLTHPLGNLRQYRPFNDTVEDAATVLRLGWHPDDRAAAAAVVPVPYPALEEATLTHEFTEADREQLTWTLSEVGY